MMSTGSSTATLYPPGGWVHKDRRGHASGDFGLPPGTVVFSADNHISVAEDIFYERFPDDLQGAPRRASGTRTAPMVGMKGKSWVARDFGRVLMQYDDLAGAASNNIEARVRELQGGRHRRNSPSRTRSWRCSTTRQGDSRAGVPHLQRAHRRSAGAFQRSLLRRRAHQLVDQRVPAARWPS